MLIGAIAYTVGLWNASLNASEKGFYAISCLMSLFASIAVQKNVRDLALFREDEPADASE